MKTLYIDAFAGVSGNMLMGALMDCGVPFEYLQEEFLKLHLGDYELVHRPVDKCGIRATYFNVLLPDEPEHSHDHGHVEHTHEHTHAAMHVHEASATALEHTHHHHEHRNLHDIEHILAYSDLDSKIIAKATAVFKAIAVAEAKVHGKSIEEVHFHEVGAIDTIIDIVGNILALDYLKIEKIYVGPITTGFGFVNCAHGLMPVPAPATAELLQGLPHTKGIVEKEMTTPTGAALMKVLAEPVPEAPAGFVSEKIGYGAGTREVEIPNVVRVNLGTCTTTSRENLEVLECNVDDLNPQLLPYTIERIMAAGALDAWSTPILMKKGRPAFTLSVLCRREQKAALETLLLMETTTIGVRSYSVNRLAAERTFKTVTTPWGPVQVKYALLQDKVINIAPEFEDCKALALEHNLPLKEVLLAARELAEKSLENE